MALGDTSKVSSIFSKKVNSKQQNWKYLDFKRSRIFEWKLIHDDHCTISAHADQVNDRIYISMVLLKKEREK